MNKNKVEDFVSGLKQTNENIKKNKVDIKSFNTHADVIRIVALKLPELENCYTISKRIGGWSGSEDRLGIYHFGDDRWADALAIFLQIKLHESKYIYQSLNAFDGNNSTLTSVISHWDKMLHMVKAEYKKSLEQIDLQHLKAFAEQLHELPEKMHNDKTPVKYDSGTYKEDMIGTHGYHAGLISIVATSLPDLQECYDTISALGGWEYSSEDLEQLNYNSYTHWADALALYLGFKFDKNSYVHKSLRKALCDWASEHAEIWGTAHGGDMFSNDKSGAAFGGYGGRAPYNFIIDQWYHFFDRLEYEVHILENGTLEENRLKQLKEYELEQDRLKDEAIQNALFAEEDAHKKSIRILIVIALFLIIATIATNIETVKGGWWS